MHDTALTARLKINHKQEGKELYQCQAKEKREGEREEGGETTTKSSNERPGTSSEIKRGLRGMRRDRGMR